MLGMSRSNLFWRLYRLLHENSLLDEMDLEMVEEYYLRSEKKSLITFKSVSFILVATVVIASGFCSTYTLGFLVIPAVFIGLLEATKYFFYCTISSYFHISADFNSVFHRIIAAIRSREAVFFGMRKKFDMNATLCLRSLRLELLEVLRCEVRCHVRMSRNLCKYDDSEKLLCEMFTIEMSRLALEDDICDEFLQLSALKELWQLLFLLRSEYLRLFLLQLLCPSLRLIPIFLNLLHETVFLRNCKARLLHSLEAIRYRDCCTKEKEMQKFPPFSSTAEKILAHLSFASEILNGNDVPDEEKFLCVVEILKKAIEISTPKTQIEREDIIHSSISSNSSISGTDEIDPVVDELPIEKVYEGFSLVAADERKEILLPSWQESEFNDAIARSVVVELKSRLVERVRKLDTTKIAKIDHARQMAAVNEFREVVTVDENCDTKQAAGQGDPNIFSSILKNNVFRSHIKLDLKQAISFIKSGPSVDFIDDPGNE